MHVRFHDVYTLCLLLATADGVDCSAGCKAGTAPRCMPSSTAQAQCRGQQPPQRTTQHLQVHLQNVWSQRQQQMTRSKMTTQKPDACHVTHGKVWDLVGTCWSHFFVWFQHLYSGVLFVQWRQCVLAKAWHKSGCQPCYCTRLGQGSASGSDCSNAQLKSSIVAATVFGDVEAFLVMWQLRPDLGLRLNQLMHQPTVTSCDTVWQHFYLFVCLGGRAWAFILVVWWSCFGLVSYV